MLDIYVYISDETEACEQIGYDVDVWEDNQNGRVEDLSVVGFTTLPKAEQYVEELKSKYNVVCVVYQ